jgi:superfamily II DNA or RNA helicase
MPLRDYQIAGIAGINRAWAAGRRAPLYVLPTGGGKTVLFCHIAAHTPLRVGILMHRRELIDQTCRALGDTPHGVVLSGQTPNRHARVQVCSVQTLVNRMDRYQFDLLIIDEAHHTTATTWRKITAAYPDAYRLGVTATPCRTDGTGLAEAGFDDLILGPSVTDLTARGFLAPARTYSFAGFNRAGLHVQAGDFIAAEALERREKSVRVGDVIAHYRQHADGKPAICFCISRADADAWAERFNTAGYRAAQIDGTKTNAERRALISALGNGALQVLTTCDLISEGVDVPVVECGIFLRPTQSMGLWMQQMGRILRAAPGKQHAVLLDHVGNALKHGVPETPREWSLVSAKRTKKEAEVDVVSVRVCAQCCGVHVPLPVCPFCGYVYPIRQREIEEMDGQLTLLDAQWGAVKPVHRAAQVDEWKANSLEDFQAIAEARGYKPGWAWHRWQAKQKRVTGATA